MFRLLRVLFWGPRNPALGEAALIRTLEEGGQRRKDALFLQSVEKGCLAGLLHVNAEGIGNSAEMAKVIEIATGVETRATVLGHIQRGGNPTCKDRVFASAMGAKAVELLCEGKSNRVVGYKEGEFVDFDIQEALAMDKGLDPFLWHITKKLTTR